MNSPIINKYRDYLPLFGRFGITLIFIVNGLHKGLEFEEYSMMLAAKGFPFTSFFLVISIAVELLGGILVMIGYKVEKSAFIMSAYLIVATFVYHPIWDDMTFFLDFVKNLAIIGGLLTLAYHGGGPRSVDTYHEN